MTDKIEIADPELIAAFARAVENNQDTSHAALAQSLDRSRADTVKRTLERAQAGGLITLSPPTVTKRTRDILIAAGLIEGEAANTQTGEIRMVATADMRPSPFNPRKYFDPAKIEELARAIVSEGLIHNLLARPDAENPGKFEIVAGERRYRAIEWAKANGLKSERFDPAAPVEVRVRELTDDQVIMLAISENMDRVDPHPLEEAEAFRRLRDLRASQDGDKAGDTATQEIADMIGKSRRFVQLRIALAEKLTEATAKAFQDDTITLAQARALATTSAYFQDAAIENIKNGFYGYQTADQILKKARGEAFAASNAIFDLGEYTGETWTDPDSGDEYLCDLAAVEKLQREAAASKAETLKAGPAGFVEIVDWFRQYDYTEATEANAAECGYVIEFSPHSLTVEIHHVGPRNPQTEAGRAEDAAQKKADERKALAEASGEEGVAPYERRHINAGRAARTAEVQHTLATHAHYNVATALAILGTLETLAPMYDGTLRISTTRPTSDDRDVFVGGQLAAAIEKRGAVDGLTVKGSGVFVVNREKALRALATHKRLHDLHAAAVADQIGTACSFNGTPGDSDFFRAIADLIGVTHAGQNSGRRCDEAYFARFTRGSQTMLAKSAGHDVDALPEKKAEAAKALAAAEAEAETAFIPPEWHIDGDIEIEADIAAMLRGNAAGETQAQEAAQ